MNWLDLIRLGLCVFYVAYAIANTNGPFQAFAKARERFPLGGLTACMVCLSPWIAATVYVLSLVGLGVVVDVLAIAGAAVFIFRWTGGSYVSN